MLSVIVQGCFATPHVPISRSLNLSAVTLANDLEAVYEPYEAQQLPSLSNATHVSSLIQLIHDFNASTTAAQAEFQPTVDEAQAKLNEIVSNFSQVVLDTTALYAHVGSVHMAVKRMATALRRIDKVTGSSCDFLPPSYTRLVTEVCDGSVTALSTLSLFGFAIGVCAIAMLVTSILISNRIFHYEELPVANVFARTPDAEDDFVRLKATDSISSSGSSSDNYDNNRHHPVLAEPAPIPILSVT
jgi:hypothetical protein